MNLFTKIRAALGDIAAMDKDLGEKITATEAKIAELKSAPLSKADYMAHMQSSIDAVGQAYIARLTHRIEADMQRPALDFAEPDANYRIFAPLSPDGHQRVTPEALAFFFGDALKKQAVAAVKAVTWPTDKAGPPLAERKLELERLNQELASLQKQRAELRREAADAGLHLGNLSELNESMLSKAELSAKRQRDLDQAGREKGVTTVKIPFKTTAKRDERHPGVTQ
jgi:hypothetical protein